MRRSSIPAGYSDDTWEQTCADLDTVHAWLLENGRSNRIGIERGTGLIRSRVVSAVHEGILRLVFSVDSQHRINVIHGSMRYPAPPTYTYPNGGWWNKRGWFG